MSLPILTAAECMTAAEMHSLALGELHFAIVEVGAALVGCAGEAVAANQALSTIRNAWRLQDGTYKSKTEYEVALEDAQCAERNVKISIRKYRDLRVALNKVAEGVK